MDSAKTYSTWVEIDLSAIENNVRYVSRHTGVQVMAIVKANAYGHGAVAVAKAALRAGASWCGVARVEEGVELRQNGVACPILLLGYAPPESYALALKNDLSLSVWSAEQISPLAHAASSVGAPARLHLKVDTGMSRNGAQPEDALQLAQILAGAPGVVFEGVFTHFALADEPERHVTQEQEARFIQVCQAIEESGLRPQVIHAANSAAALTRPSAAFDLVRLGIAMYGLHPSRQAPCPAEFRPALAWKTVLSQVKRLPPGRGVSYGHEYVTQTEELIGTMPVGYADGFHRLKGNQALVSGVKVPVVGRVCMDYAMLSLQATPAAQPGDEVVLIGRQGEAHISAEDIAARWGTINYEVACAVGARVPRVYL
ncbi:MAG: alanine racemase [Anaerolineales bacterium]|nr:alanine racemase [Anaerolineales bacterium]